MARAAQQRTVDVERGEACWRASFFAMGSPCEVLCEANVKDIALDVGRAAAKEAWRIEDKLSRYVPGNIIDSINTSQGAAVEVDEETARLIDFTVTLYDLSDGRFDITSGVLRRVWTFDGSDRVPSERQVASLLELVGWDKVEWSSPTLRMPAGMEVDLGGVGKEYAVDRAAGIASRMVPGSCLVNFGGDLAVTRNPETREAWHVGVDAPGDTLIRLATGALATSGDARRYLLKDGVRYAHILDPTTGWPIEGAPASVTVAADTCVQAGMLSTLAMLRGPGASAFLEAQGNPFWLS